MSKALEPSLRDRLTRNLANFERRPILTPGLRPAAVAFVVVADARGSPAFVLTKRASRLRQHPGQWALPGGRAEPGESAPDVALREMAEEVGVTVGLDAVVGLLDDYATRSGYVITPVVVWIGRRVTLEINEAEVAAAYDIPLTELGKPEVPQLREIPESDRPVISVPLAKVGTSIHAPTAAIIWQFWEVAMQGRDTRVAHYEQPVFAWK